MVDKSATEYDYTKMFPERFKLLYEIRDALGWNDKTSLSLIPDGIKELRAENEKLRKELEALKNSGSDGFTEYPDDIADWKYFDNDPFLYPVNP